MTTKVLYGHDQRQDPNPKTGSIRYKRMLAAMSPDYRMAVLLGFPLAPSRKNQG